MFHWIGNSGPPARQDIDKRRYLGKRFELRTLISFKRDTDSNCNRIFWLSSLEFNLHLPAPFSSSLSMIKEIGPMDAQKKYVTGRFCSWKSFSSFGNHIFFRSTSFPIQSVSSISSRISSLTIGCIKKLHYEKYLSSRHTRVHFPVIAYVYLRL